MKAELFAQTCNLKNNVLVLTQVRINAFIDKWVAVIRASVIQNLPSYFVKRQHLV